MFTPSKDSNFISEIKIFTPYLHRANPKDINTRCVSVISLITDKRFGTANPSILSIKNRQVKPNRGISKLVYLSVP